MSVVKRRLEALLPGAHVFLECARMHLKSLQPITLYWDLTLGPDAVRCSVDDMEQIAYLESYVDSSGCVLVFLSRGYFYSRNVRRA